MIMSARQFAEKYPNEVVKISAEGAKEYGVNPNTIIGNVVGFRPGTQGIVGSSKVAIYAGDGKQQIKALDPRTDKTYTAIVPGAPPRQYGIYFISVMHIELKDKPEPVVAYPNRCGKCGAPARNSKRISICSNVSCKANRATIKSLGLFPKIRVVDEKGYILCPFCQGKNLVFTSTRNKLVCSNHPHHVWTHKWQEGQKMHYRGTDTYIWRKGQLERTK